jgi:phosphotransferase system enzyme I (PtsI)
VRLVDQVCRAGRTHTRPVAVCGEAAADPLIAPLLVGLGVSHLSVGVASIRQVHDVLSGFTLAQCQAAAHAALQAGTSAEVHAIAQELQRHRTEAPICA